MNTEIELKFIVPAEAQQRFDQIARQYLLSGTEPSSKLIRNRYFDTQERHLRKMDMGLRVRVCEDFIEQTIKTKGRVVAGLHQRPEYNVLLDDEDPKLSLFPESLKEQIGDTEEVQQLIIPIFTTDFERTSYELVVDNGSVIEAVFDKGFIRTDNQKLAFSEIELELKSGSAKDMFALAERVMSECSARLGKQSKAARGYMLVDNVEPMPMEMFSYANIDESDSGKEAFLKTLELALDYWQQNETCYLDTGKIIALSHVVSGVKFVRHLFSVYQDIIGRDIFKQYDQRLQQLDEQLNFADQAIQLKELTSKKGKFRKVLAEDKFLLNHFKEKLADEGVDGKMMAIIGSKPYNALLLDLLKLSFTDISGGSHDELISLAKRWLSASWMDVAELMPSETTMTMEDYLANEESLRKNMTSGVCFGGLYDEYSRELFRSPWKDILQGMAELRTLNKLKGAVVNLDTGNNNDLIAWCNTKIASLLDVMEQTREAALKQKPYW